MKLYVAIMVFMLSILSVHGILYGDLTFNVAETGDVAISGQTNYGPFQGITENLTSKQGEYWLLNISSPVFEDYIYHINLPKNAAVNYLNTNTKIRIEDTNGIITIIGTGHNQSIYVLTQYTIQQISQSDIIYIVCGIILIALGIWAYILFRKNKKNTKQTRETEHKELNRDIFTERQWRIIEYLQKHGNVTQAELEKELRLPKSSLSRNVETLAKKGVIFKETTGMSNVVGLNQ